jgi:protein subunit release factor B
VIPIILSPLYNAIISFYLGAGGVDSMDFVDMLKKMYLVWAKSRRKQATIVDETNDQKTDGLKNCTIRFSNSMGKKKDNELYCGFDFF